MSRKKQCAFSVWMTLSLKSNPKTCLSVGFGTKWMHWCVGLHWVSLCLANLGTSRTSSALWVLRWYTCPVRSLNMMCPVTLQDATVTRVCIMILQMICLLFRTVSVQFDCCYDGRPLQTLHELQWTQYSRLGNYGIVWELWSFWLPCISLRCTTKISYSLFLTG